MTRLTGLMKEYADKSVVYDCFGSLFISFFKKNMSDIWPDLDEIDFHELYLNDGDVERPAVSVKKRKRRALVDITIYESEFGERRSDTRDFDTEAVLEVCMDRYQRAFLGVVDCLKLEEEDARALKSKIIELLDEFENDFDPTKSLAFKPQPKPKKGTFFLDGTSKRS